MRILLSTPSNCELRCQVSMVGAFYATTINVVGLKQSSMENLCINKSSFAFGLSLPSSPVYHIYPLLFNPNCTCMSSSSILCLIVLLELTFSLDLPYTSCQSPLFFLYIYPISSLNSSTSDPKKLIM